MGDNHKLIFSKFSRGGRASVNREPPIKGYSFSPRVAHEEPGQFNCRIIDYLCATGVDCLGILNGRGLHL